MAWSTTTLAWGIIEYEDAWTKAGELDNALDAIKWPLDFFLKSHPDPDTFYVQVGDGDSDHQFWGPAEALTMDRPAYAVTNMNAGTEAPAEAAAALAAGYLAFKDVDSVYANQLLTAAKSLFDLAINNQGTLTISDPFYK